MPYKKFGHSQLIFTRNGLLKFVAVGECTLDRYAHPPDERVGGISLNFALNARGEGESDVALVSCVGTDAAADRVRTALEQAGVDVRQLHSLPGRTASQSIELRADGERIFPPGGYDPGVLADFRLGESDLALIRAADVIAVPCFRQLALLFDPILHARDLRAFLVADLLDGEDLGAGLDGIDPLLDVLDLLFISGDERTVARLLPRSRGTRSLLVVTHGATGSSALVRGERLIAPADPVPPAERVDTNGCGDAFQAAFTVSYLRHRDVQSALHAGARRAARVIRHAGATSDDD